MDKRGEQSGRTEEQGARRKDCDKGKNRESSTNFVACLCHQHPVGTTDVQMMSCRKGIGREGGASGAREDSGQAEPRPEREGRGGEEEGRQGEGAALWQPSTALPSRNHSVFIRFDSKLGQNESSVLCAVCSKRVCKCEGNAAHARRARASLRAPGNKCAELVVSSCRTHSTLCSLSKPHRPSEL